MVGISLGLTIQFYVYDNPDSSMKRQAFYSFIYQVRQPDSDRRVPKHPKSGVPVVISRMNSNLSARQKSTYFGGTVLLSASQSSLCTCLLIRDAFARCLDGPSRRTSGFISFVPLKFVGERILEVDST